MIQIIQITQFSNIALANLKIPALPNPAQFNKPGEGLFVVVKTAQIIGFGGVQQSPDAPPTAGIALVNHCYLIPSERQKGYGNRLFRHLRQFSSLHFGLLQLNDDCPMRERLGAMIEL